MSETDHDCRPFVTLSTTGSTRDFLERKVSVLVGHLTPEQAERVMQAAADAIGPTTETAPGVDGEQVFETHRHEGMLGVHAHEGGSDFHDHEGDR
jgi:hypothetical protein